MILKIFFFNLSSVEKPFLTLDSIFAHLNSALSKKFLDKLDKKYL
jgi:hypothetical protein